MSMTETEPIRYNDGFAEKWVEFLSPDEWRGRVTLEYINVPLSKLEHAGCATDPAVVAGWVHSLEFGVPIPPPVAVLTERGTYYLHDGNHRLQALREFCADTSTCLVRVALAKPAPGHRFVSRRFDGYSTYVLEPTNQGIDVIARATAAILLSSISLGITAALPGADHSPFLALPMAAVMLSAWLGGWKAGIVASVFSLSGTAYYLLAPNRSFLIERTPQLVQFGLLAAIMVLTVGFAHYLRLHPRVEIQFPALFRRRKGPAGE